MLNSSNSEDPAVQKDGEAISHVLIVYQISTYVAIKYVVGVNHRHH